MVQPKIKYLNSHNKRKTYTKSNLPTKICEVCGKSFAWRRKWEKVWDEVKYCSDKCRTLKNKKGGDAK